MTIGLLVLSALLFLNNQDQGLQDKLIGVWIPDEDGYDYRWVFKEDGTLERYSQGNLWRIFTYSIETNPNCIVPVTVEEGLYYVKVKEKSQLENAGNTNALELCYELDGVPQDRLSLIYVEGASYRPTTFKRFVPQQGD